MKFELQTMDWVSSPGGLLAWKAIKDGGMAPVGKVHPMDVYTIPSIVEDLGLMIHKVLVAMGAAKVSTEAALTFYDWTKKYVEHLWAAKHLPDETRLSHLDECHCLFALSLQVAGDRMAETLNCLRPDLHDTIPPFFPLNEKPLSVIIEWQTTREQALNLMHAHRGIFAPVGPSHGIAASSSEDPWELPRRSRKHRVPDDPVTKKQRTGVDTNPTPERSRAEPGSLVATHLWLVKDTELYVSGKVWFVRKVAAHLKVKVADFCWPVLLNARVGDNRLAHCDNHRARGHESLTATAHTVERLDLDELSAIAHRDKLWRYPEKTEKAKLLQRIAKAGLDAPPTFRPGRGRGRGRSSGGRRRGFQ